MGLCARKGKDDSEMDVAKMSEPEKLAGFYKQWVEHTNAGGEDSDEEWAKLAKAWKLSDPPKKAPPSKTYVVRSPRSTGMFSGGRGGF
jgi:hypothetical protein